MIEHCRVNFPQAVIHPHFREFASEVPPVVPIDLYMQRFLSYSHAGESTLLFTLVNLDKLVQKYSEWRYIVFNDYTKHRILISLLVISNKFLEDLYYDNLYYA